MAEQLEATPAVVAPHPAGAHAAQGQVQVAEVQQAVVDAPAAEGDAPGEVALHSTAFCEYIQRQWRGVPRHDGKRFLRSLINGAKDAQQMLNFWRTSGTELVALAPRVPYIGEEGAFDVDQERWQTANTKSHPFLEYTQGKQPPMRQPLDGGAAAGAGISIAPQTSGVVPDGVSGSSFSFTK